MTSDAISRTGLCRCRLFRPLHNTGRIFIVLTMTRTICRCEFQVSPFSQLYCVAITARVRPRRRSISRLVGRQAVAAIHFCLRADRHTGSCWSLQHATPELAVRHSRDSMTAFRTSFAGFWVIASSKISKLSSAKMRADAHGHRRRNTP